MSDRAAITRRTLRDLATLGAMAALLVLDARTAQGSATSLAIGAALGALVTLSAFLLHEWGHYAGARLAGARPVPTRSAFAVFLFDLDEPSCTREQWLAMSLGGYLASLVAVALIATWIDLGRASGIVTAVLAGLGIAATFAIELPITWRVYRHGVRARG